jgi:hypothetical protein
MGCDSFIAFDENNKESELQVKHREDWDNWGRKGFCLSHKHDKDLLSQSSQLSLCSMAWGLSFA